MDDGATPPRIVLFASQDLEDIYAYTSHLWGTAQAEAYAQFLLSVVQDAADNPYHSRPVQELQGVRSIFAKWRKARHGHHLIFELREEGIYVLRVLHAARDWPALIGE